LGFEWAYRHQVKVKGIVYMEALLFLYEWSDWPDEIGEAVARFVNALK